LDLVGVYRSAINFATSCFRFALGVRITPKARRESATK
jgi:hypothetical protein